jgi:uncharacterized integral membrane protein (TIGR00698 family)
LFKIKRATIDGVIFVAFFAIVAIFLSKIDIIESSGVSPLVIGISLGIIVANSATKYIPTRFQEGITFSAKRVLRLAIILYGFRLTFQDIASVGVEGFIVSVTMLSSTLLLGTFIGLKIFKLNRDTAILTASGASVCGAAAVLATESVVKGSQNSVAVAVSMVVLFGTISMFLYPLLYEGFIKDATGFFHMSPSQFGIYVGGTVHEVAQVVAIPASIPNAPKEMVDSAVIVKMTRVLLIAPTLIILGVVLALNSKDKSSRAKIVIPWFAIYFILVVGFNSLNLVSAEVKEIINSIDTFLLTMAMTALGMGTNFSKFKNSGIKALYTASVIFIWLLVGGFIVTKIVTEIF